MNRSSSHVARHRIPSVNAPARTLLLALLAGTASHAHAFELSSPDLAPGQPIPETFAFDAFGCTGQNVSPALAWEDLPAGTRSVAVMVHDSDARWVQYLNVPDTATASFTGFVIHSMALGSATFEATYDR